MTPLHRRVAATVRAEMARRALLQSDVAKLLGLAQQRVSSRLRGDTPFTLNEVEILADHFDMSPGQLVDADTSERPDGRIS